MRKKTRSTSALIGIVALFSLTASVYVVLNKPAPLYIPDLAEALQMPKVPLQQHLYSPGDSRQRGVEIMAPNQVDAQDSYLTNKDGSMVYTRLAADGKTPFRQEFYFPRQPGETFNRQKSAFTYEADGKTPSHREEYRLDGTANFVLNTLEHGNRQLIEYHPDGASIIRVTVQDKSGSNKLREENYAPIGDGNYLLWDEVLNEDHSKTTTWYDRQQNVLKTKHKTTSWNEEGTVIESFYPGTKKTRLKSETAYAPDSPYIHRLETKANFYRLDGSLESQQILTSSYIDVTYFDADGSTVLYKQHLEGTWERGVQHWRLKKAEERLADGSSREVVYAPWIDHMDKVIRANFSLDGVKYKEGTYYYRVTGDEAGIGTLRQTSLTPADGSTPFDLKEYQASENIRPDIPAYLTKLPDLSDDLPKPDNSYSYGWGGQ